MCLLHSPAHALMKNARSQQIYNINEYDVIHQRNKHEKKMPAELKLEIERRFMHCALNVNLFEDTPCTESEPIFMSSSS